MSFTDLACCAGCLGAVGVRGDVSALEWDGACVDGACLDGACTDGACSCPLLEFPRELNFFIARIWCSILISCGVHSCSSFVLRTCS